MDEKKFLDLDGLAYFKQKLDEEYGKSGIPYLDYSDLDLFELTTRQFLEKIAQDLKLNDIYELSEKMIFMSLNSQHFSQSDVANIKIGILLIDTLKSTYTNVGLDFVNLFYQKETYHRSFQLNESNVSSLFDFQNKNQDFLAMYGNITIVDNSDKMSYLRDNFVGDSKIPAIVKIGLNLYIIYIDGNKVCMLPLNDSLGIWSYCGSLSSSDWNNMTISQFLSRYALRQPDTRVKTMDCGFERLDNMQWICEIPCEFGEKVEMTIKVVNGWSGNLNDVSLFIENTEAQEYERIPLIFDASLYGNGDLIDIVIEPYETQTLIKAFHIEPMGTYTPLEEPLAGAYIPINYLTLEGFSFDKVSLNASSVGTNLDNFNWQVLVKHQKTEVE